MWKAAHKFNVKIWFQSFALMFGIHEIIVNPALFLSTWPISYSDALNMNNLWFIKYVFYGLFVYVGVKAFRLKDSRWWWPIMAYILIWMNIGLPVTRSINPNIQFSYNILAALAEAGWTLVVCISCLMGYKYRTNNILIKVH